MNTKQAASKSRLGSKDLALVDKEDTVITELKGARPELAELVGQTDSLNKLLDLLAREPLSKISTPQGDRP